MLSHDGSLYYSIISRIPCAHCVLWLRLGSSGAGGRLRTGTTIPTVAALVGTCSFRSYDRTRLGVHHDTAAVREVNVPHDRPVLILQHAVIDRVARTCGHGCLLGLL